MYSTIYRILRLFLHGGVETRQHLSELRRTQWFSKEELEEYQLAKIQKVVRHAYEKIPYYRNLYTKLNIHPEDIKSFSDFRSLPVITKPEIINHLDEFVQPELRSLAQEVSTGGSTGEPMKVYVEDSFWWWNAAYEQRGREWYGVHEGDKTAWFWGAQKDMHEQGLQARLKAETLRHRYLNAAVVSESKMKEFADMLLKWKPELFRAYASTLYFFAQYVEANKITGIRPRLIETTAEKLRPHQRALIEKVFQAPIAECYAAREFGTIGYMCAHGRMHVGETRYMEIVDHKKHAVQAGQYGQPVNTSLHQFLMPLIRYKMDDEIAYDHETCPCGRALPALKEIRGRINDHVVTPEGKFVNDDVFDYYFWPLPEVTRYQVYQSDKGHLEIRLVLNREVGAGWVENARAYLRTQLGEKMEIEFQFVDDIPLTRAGKERFVISEVKQEFINS